MIYVFHVVYQSVFHDLCLLNPLTFMGIISDKIVYFDRVFLEIVKCIYGLEYAFSK